ncbi:uncharacterized protein LOC109720375 isoform X2 [Ananas comosus]|uniref:Uncharacterized protein LOC109720375 isoform X2 n=1 Tax=Ananas comosus TaxID=4615 RepID=A0A6P5G5A3_ANACO|nr:uncharacterized protein LOC109720375 isoform X2 [Ananas comosus]
MRGDDHAVEARGSAEGASDPIPSRYVARPHHLLPQTLHRHQILDHHHGKISDFGSSPWQNLRFWIITMAKSQILDHHHGKISGGMLSWLFHTP